MGKTISNFLTALFALAGCIVALVLTWEHFLPTADIGCAAVGGNCHATIDSAYGHIGPIPTSIIGLAMYLVVGILCVQRFRLMREQRLLAEQEQARNIAAYDRQVNPEDASSEAARAELESLTGDVPTPEAPTPNASSRNVAIALKRRDGMVWGIALLAFGISWWLQYVSLTVIHSFCPWCFSSALLVTLIFALSSYSYLIYGRTITGETKLLVGVLTFAAVMGSIIAYGPFIEWVHTQLFRPAKGDKVDISVKSVVLSRQDIPIKGDPNAQIYVVEFADYQCSHCQLATKMLDEFMKKNPKKMRLGYRSFPLQMHQWAKKAAIAAEAAGEQGKFWEMHDYIFEHQKAMESPAFTDDSFDQWAAELGLKMDKFKKDRNDPRIEVRVEQDEYDAKHPPLNIGFTPSFYVITKTNMYAFSGSTEFKKALDDPNNIIWK
jgi:protein-disulfide isomerase/uncharacterized membrane protein